VTGARGALAASACARGQDALDRGELAIAVRSYAEALAADPDLTAARDGLAEALYRSGLVASAAGRHAEALDSFDRALVLKPRAAATLVQRGAALHRLGRYPAALASFDQALQLAPDDADARFDRAIALHSLGRADEAIAAYGQALAVAPGQVEARLGRAALLQAAGRDEEARIDLEHALELRPDREHLLGDVLFARMSVCAWTGYAETLARLEAGLLRGEPTASPFVAMALSGSPRVQRRAAEDWIVRRNPRTEAPRWSSAGSGAKVRLGYFSSDLHEHATTSLLGEVLELHDRDGFEVHAYSFGPATDDAARARVMAASTRFHEVGRMSDAEIAAMARADGIDIAIDLKGFTFGARTGIFALGAAPVQVNYLGYPGTMGAPYVDYLIADHALVPDAARADHAEQVVRLPDSYQPNDRRRALAARTPSRAEVGLPEGAFVFCAFNRAYKITPTVFASWMRVLAAIEGSVLWLLVDGAAARAALAGAAARQGIAPERLVWAEPLPSAAHLARQRLADLFLDTSPCNAHTTASDALWAGLPVLTMTGAAFASRVATSLVRAVGQGELAVGSSTEYEALAIALARDRSRLARLKGALALDPAALPLFDAPRYVRHLETAFARMHERRRQGLPAAAFDVEA